VDRSQNYHRKHEAFGFEPFSNDKVLGHQENFKGRKYDSFVIAAPISVESGNHAGDYFMGIVVRRMATSDRFYLHEITTQKRADVPFKFHPNAVSRTPGGNTNSSLSSLMRLLQDVKELMNAARDDVGQLYSDRQQEDLLPNKRAILAGAFDKDVAPARGINAFLF